MALTPQPSMLSSKLGHTSQTFGTFSSTRNLMPHPVSRELAVNRNSRRGVSAASGAVSFMTATSFHTAAASGTTDTTLEDRHLPSFVSITTKEQDYPARLTMATELTQRTSSSTSAERYGDSSLSTSLGDASDASQKEHARRSENIERPMTAREIKTLLGGLRVSEGAEDDLTRWTKVLTMAAAVYKNETAKKVQEIEKEFPGDFNKVAPYLKGMNYKTSFQVTGNTQDSIWSCGQVIGLIDDIPTCKELVERIVSEAESIMRGRLQYMLVSKL